LGKIFIKTDSVIFSIGISIENFENLPQLISEYKLYTFGAGVNGQLGYMPEPSEIYDRLIQTAPREIPEFRHKVKSIVCDKWMLGVVTMDNDFYEAGYEEYIPPTEEDYLLKERYPQLHHNVKSVSFADVYEAIVTLDGNLYMIGTVYGIETHDEHYLSSENQPYIIKSFESIIAEPKKVEYFQNNVEMVACGKEFTAVITVNHDLVTFGDSKYIGRSADGNYALPGVVPEFNHRVKYVACGTYHTVFITLDDKIFVFGLGGFGRLGTGTEYDKLTPVELRYFGNKIKFFSCGADNTIFITQDGKVFMTGHLENVITQIRLPGDPANIPRTYNPFYPKEIRFPEMGNVISASCGVEHIALITSDHKLYTCGEGKDGQLGHGERGNYIIPKLVESLRDVKLVACGAWATAVVTGILEFKY
jgi:alpha-tubulin suppressor-like RCC1 family protein